MIRYLYEQLQRLLTSWAISLDLEEATLDRFLWTAMLPRRAKGERRASFVARVVAQHSANIIVTRDDCLGDEIAEWDALFSESEMLTLAPAEAILTKVERVTIH